jgi:hypothetical protein
MGTSRFKQALFALGMTAALSCGGVTLRALQAENPRAETLEVPCRPSIIPNNVSLMAVQSNPGHIVTDEQPDELIAFAPVAKGFIEFNEDAPLVNVTIMAVDYGLSCPNFVVSRQDPSEFVTENQGRDRLFVGQQAQASTTGANATSKPPRQVRICAKPLGNNVDNWFGTEQFKGTSTTANAGKYEKEKIRASIVFVYDASAPPESVWNLGPNTKVRCPGKAPMPYAQYMASINGVGSPNGGSSSTTGSTSGTTDTNTQKKGDEKTNDTSSPNGKGPPLTTWEDFLRQLSLAGSLASGDASGKTDHAQGNRYGATTGQNVGGFSFPPLQAGYALLQILSATGTNAKSFVDDIIQNAKRGQRSLIKEADEKMLKVADELIGSHGRYEMAHGLQEMGTIMPYELGGKFTEKLGGKFQAHKIFEKRAFKRFNMEGVDKAPCVILTDTKHKEISTKLAAAWKGNETNMTKEQLRKIYQDVYKDFPHWLEAIEPYFR